MFLCLWSYVIQLKTALLVWIILNAITQFNLFPLDLVTYFDYIHLYDVTITLSKRA